MGTYAQAVTPPPRPAPPRPGVCVWRLRFAARLYLGAVCPCPHARERMNPGVRSAETRRVRGRGSRCSGV